MGCGLFVCLYTVTVPHYAASVPLCSLEKVRCPLWRECKPAGPPKFPQLKAVGERSRSERLDRLTYKCSHGERRAWFRHVAVKDNQRCSSRDKPVISCSWRSMKLYVGSHLKNVGPTNVPLSYVMVSTHGHQT
jgi:hypothetical protein